MTNRLSFAVVAAALLGSASLAVAQQGSVIPEPRRVERLPGPGRTVESSLPVNRPDSPVSIFELDQIDFETLEMLEGFNARVQRARANPRTHALFDLGEPVRLPSTALSPESVPGLPGRAPDDFVLTVNSSPSSVAPNGFSSPVNEPTAYAVGDTVLYTANWFAAFSSNGGNSWSFVNPFSGPFSEPASSPGFCCDQITEYDPGTDTAFYLQQYIEGGGTGVQRINIDQGADGTFECSLDVTPQAVGFPTNNWSDFPDLAAGSTYLYLSSNVFPSSGGGFTGAFVLRLSLTDLASCSGSVTAHAYTDASYGSFRFTRGATTTMYFASHATSSSMRIWSWPDGSGSPGAVDRTVTAWSNATRVCPGPDGRDWCGFIDHRMPLGAVGDGRVIFGWNPAQDGSHPYPYTRIAVFDDTSLTLQSEADIWSSTHAWVYPSAAANANGDIGGTVMFGGGTSFHPSCAAFLVDDTNGDSWAPLENSTVIVGTTGPGSNRSGDYLSARVDHPDNQNFQGACFAYTATTAGDSRFVRFGREGAASIFSDGFEGGNTTQWSAEAP